MTGKYSSCNVESLLPKNSVQPYPLGRVIYQHGLYQVKQLLVILSVSLLVLLQQLAVLPHILPSRAVLIPHQLTSAEVFCLCSSGHPEICKVTIKQCLEGVWDTYDAGKGPKIFSIMARCSLLSWVWNKVNPRYSSNMMHPMLHTSHGWDHPSSKITSGALEQDSFSSHFNITINMLVFGQYSYHPIPVVACGHHLAVVLPVKRCRSKVNQADFGAFYLPHIFPLKI